MTVHSVHTVLRAENAWKLKNELRRTLFKELLHGYTFTMDDASAAYLSVSDIKNAVSVLIHGHELELALVVSLSLSPIFNDSEHFLRIISEKIVKYRLEPIASAQSVIIYMCFHSWY